MGTGDRSGTSVDPGVVELLGLFQKECRLAGFLVRGPKTALASDGSPRYRLSVGLSRDSSEWIAVGEMCTQAAGEVYVWSRRLGGYRHRCGSWEEAVEKAEEILRSWGREEAETGGRPY